MMMMKKIPVCDRTSCALTNHEHVNSSDTQETRQCSVKFRKHVSSSYTQWTRQCSVTQEIIFGLVDDKFRRSTQYIMRNPILFGDYRTALDEAEPRLYEDLQDYEAVKSLFQEVGMNHKLQTKRQTRAGQYGDSDSEAKGIRLSFFFLNTTISVAY